jgi:flagellar biosynthesis/type III secretory pathway chaperone
MKMIGSCTGHLEMLQILPCEMLNSHLRNAKFLNNKTNLKHAWKTVNEILGRSQKQNIVNEINLLEKTITSTSELVNVFNDYFTDVGPKLAEKIEYEHNCSF